MLRTLLCLPKIATLDEAATPTEVVKEYAESASPHGISRIHSSRHIISRSFWVIAFLTFLGMATVQIMVIAEKLRSNDYITQIKVKIHKNGLEFPAITICNSNAYRLTEVSKLLDKVHQNNQSLSTPEGKRIFSDTLVNLSKKDPFNLGQQPEVFFKAQTCSFNGKNCSYPNDFKMISPAGLGNCFKFNPNGNISQPRNGVRHGLFLVVNIDQNDYNTHDPEMHLLPAGVYITVHNNEQGTDLKSYSVLATPNQLTRIALKQKRAVLLKHPYEDNCTDGDVPSFKPLYSYGYSVDSCVLSCHTRKLFEKCGVGDMNAVLLSNWNGLNMTIPISPNDVKCLENFTANVNKGEIPCECPPLCKTTKYGMTISNSVWPSSANLKFWIKKLNLSEQSFKENMVAIQIFYNDFSVSTAIHKPSYDRNAFLSDLGGQLGLWVGCSLFSILEIFTMLLGVLQVIIFPKKKAKKEQEKGK